MRRCLVVGLIAGAAAFLPVWVHAQASFVASYVWPAPARPFGGFSGFDLAEDGRRFVAVTDRGHVVEGLLVREGGKITGTEQVRIAALETPAGKPVNDYEIDAEGVALDPDGSFHVSYEARHRVWDYPTRWGAAKQIDQHPDFERLQNNSSLEALAVDEMGVLYTIPERSGRAERPFPVYRFKNGAWDQPFTIPRRGRFLVVGADFGPDGKFYLLERDHTPFLGFRTRVRCFDLGSDGFRNEETLVETDRGTHDNLEGIAVWRDADGDIRLTMLSDNNFQLFQVTEFVEYRVGLDPLKSNR